MNREWELRDLLLPGGRRLRARARDGRGRPLVLLHGLLDDSEGWTGLARDAGLAQLRVDSCVLVGHSLGGAVATSVAERSDGLVCGLALLAPVGYGHVRLAEAFSLRGVIDVAELALPFALVNPLTMTAAYATFVAHGHMPSRDLTARLRRRAFRSGPGVRGAVQAIAAAGRSSHGFAHRRVGFDGPVAALWGEQDALVSPSHLEALRRALPQAHVEVWRGMGHHPQRERPQQLDEFIEVQAARARPRGRAAPVLQAVS
ncbi:MAG: alpha/beta fold hydrolase [Actinomycetota bacterium]|nr:alpha/beta fold hydrolase [Actinomycetota bacterium]